MANLKQTISRHKRFNKSIMRFILMNKKNSLLCTNIYDKRFKKTKQKEKLRLFE